MKNLITILTACLITINTIPMVSGQVFQKTFGEAGNEKANSIQQTLDGGFIITGVTDNLAPTADVYLLKTDANGDTLWTKTFGGDTTDVGWAVQQTADGGYIITGYTNSFGAGDYDVYLLKTDTAGNVQWTKTFGGACCFESGYSVQQTTDLGYIIAGSTKSFGAAGPGNVYLIKTDAVGDTLWTRTFGGTSFDPGFSVQQTIDGGYIIGGFTCSFGTGCDTYLIKTDANGDTLWTKIYGGINGETGNSVQQTTSDSGYIFVGSTNTFGQGFEDVYLIKTDANGNKLWTRTFGGDSADFGNSVKQTLDGGYIIAGSTNSFGAGGRDVYLIKTDSNGDTLWTKTFGGGGIDIGNSVWETSDSGFVIAGETWSFGAGGQDVYLIKVDANGNSGGCYQGNPATVVTNPLTLVSSTATQIGGGAIINSPPTIVNSTSTLVRGTISGTVTDTAGNAITSGDVKLLQFINDSTRMDSVNTAPIIAGNYIFNNVDAGKYYLVAEGDIFFYPNHIPTYYGNTHRWDFAAVNNVFCGSDIALIETEVWMGTGFCSGRIIYGVKNKTGKFLGDPAPGLDITIEQNPGGEIKQFTTTNDSGEYSFLNIPPLSIYKLFVDIPGLPMDSTYDVMIVNPTDSVYDLDFMVDTTSGSGVIFIATTPTSIRDIMIQPSYSVKVFPNPFSDATIFEIEGGGEGQIYRLEIDDIMGRNVKLIDNISALPTGQAGTIELNKEELTPGLYIYKVLNEQGLIGLGKLVVQ